jgi:hypothetical protein
VGIAIAVTVAVAWAATNYLRRARDIAEASAAQIAGPGSPPAIVT